MKSKNREKNARHKIRMNNARENFNSNTLVDRALAYAILISLSQKEDENNSKLIFLNINHEFGNMFDNI